MDRQSAIVDLLNRARDGDEPARDALFQRCRSYVRIVARAQLESWLQAKVDASDLVQQTLLDAHRGFHGFRGETEGEWLAWLKRILAHNAVDFVRHYGMAGKRQVKREVPWRDPAESKSHWGAPEPDDPGTSPSEMVIGREREIELADALTRLPPDYQEVLMLRNLQRLPFNEVARRMSRSRQAAQMLWLRALRKLKEELPA